MNGSNDNQDQVDSPTRNPLISGKGLRFGMFDCGSLGAEPQPKMEAVEAPIEPKTDHEASKEHDRASLMPKK